LGDCHQASASVPVRTRLAKLRLRRTADSWLANGELYWRGDNSDLLAYSPLTKRYRTVPVSRRLARNRLPVISPDGIRVAFWDEIGPAGTRIYNTSGSFLRNLRGVGGPDFFSPDGTKLLLGDPDAGMSVFDFPTHQLTPLNISVPAPNGSTAYVVDW
jgi:WD40-like Beta Propeller Repeat